MPEKKHHHFVPKFYLKNFTEDNQINVLNLKSYQIINKVHYTEHCRINYFHGKGTDTEDILGNIEAIVAPKIQSIINNKASDKDSDYIILQWFILLQIARTKRNVNVSRQMAESFIQTIAQIIGIKEKFEIRINPPAIPALKVVSKCLFSIIDLDYIIVKNNSATQFITSDNPVVKYNQYLRLDEVINHIGLDSKGLLILYPLSPDVLIILFDVETYKLNVGDVVEVSDEDVRTINELQLLNADEIVFIQKLLMDDERDFIEWAKEMRKSNPIIIDEPQVFQTERNKLLIINQYPKLNYYKELSFIKYIDGEAVLDKKTRKYQQREYWKQRQHTNWF